MGALVSVIVGPLAGIALSVAAAGAGIVAVALFFYALGSIVAAGLWIVQLGKREGIPESDDR